MWPLLHYVMWAETVDEKSYWEAYVKVNQMFANVVVEHYEPGDLSKPAFPCLSPSAYLSVLMNQSLCMTTICSFYLK